MAYEEPKLDADDSGMGLGVLAIPIFGVLGGIFGSALFKEAIPFPFYFLGGALVGGAISYGASLNPFIGKAWSVLMGTIIVTLVGFFIGALVGVCVTNDNKLFIKFISIGAILSVFIYWMCLLIRFIINKDTRPS